MNFSKDSEVCVMAAESRVIMIEQSMLIDDMASAVCGGRRFGRKFNKRDYPLLGDDPQEDAEKADQAILISRLSRDRLPKKLSTSVAAIRDLCYDPATPGKWRWPTNGADLVFPHIYLGDA